ncbi:MAG: tetratricopeptide repeat protein [Flavobacteriales bacterium]|nr:tetratricopeptide repeat protein [Flavobacteriales bacterium]
MRLLIAVLLFSSTIFAKDSQSLFDQAALHYEQQDYQMALSTFSQIEDIGLFSSDLYYNIANCHYKLQHKAEAVLYYEKALKLNPSDEDALFNLKLVQLQLVDKLAEVPMVFYQKWAEGIKNKMSIDQWAKLGVVFLFIFCVLFILFLFTKTYRLKKRAFTISMGSLLISFLSLSLAYYSYSTVTTEAVLMQANAYVKSAPSTQSEDLFILHEGTKVQVLEGFNNWTKIKLSDGMIGWLESDVMEEI